MHTPGPRDHPELHIEMNIGIVGYGYVGSAVAAAFADRASVRFHDPARPGSVPLADLAHDDVVFVCVPTPAGPGGDADLSAVEDVLGELQAAGATATVTLKSTVPPGTTARLAIRYARLSLAVAPEFLRERSAVHDFAHPARLVVGFAPATSGPARARLREILAWRFPGVPLVELDPTAAELVKYGANAFFAVKVGFANELADLAAGLGVAWEPVREAMGLDPRIGPDHLGVPGADGRPGFGGSCLPKDTRALLVRAEELGVDLPLLEATVVENRRRRGPG